MPSRKSRDLNSGSLYLEGEDEGEEDAGSTFDRMYDESVYGESVYNDSVASSHQELYTEEKTTAHSSSEEDEGHVQQQSTPDPAPRRHYSIDELVEALGGASSTSLSPELQRRVLDFRLAQQKRRAKDGDHKCWGIFGMYNHLSNVRIDLEWAEDAAWRRQNKAPYLSWSDFDTARKQTIRPLFTYFLIFLCSLMMIVVFALNDWKMEPLNVNPLFGPSAEALVHAGARDTNLIVEDKEWFRIFTPLALHAGLVHFFVNMAALWFIGRAVEESHGVVNTVLLFLIPGVGGNILSAIFLPQYISVGASGGIFGLIGGCVADITLNWKLLFIKASQDDRETKRRNLRAILWLVLDIVVNSLIGLTPYVDNFCHLGGLVYGICCGWSTLEPLSVGFFGVTTNLLGKAKVLFVRFFGLIVSMVAIMVTTAWLGGFEAGDSPCSSCRYLSCVPFPFFAEDKWWHCDDCDMVSANLFKTGDIYSRIDLTCPSQEVEQIQIAQFEITDRDELRHRLPGYCREFCEDRFN